MRPAAPDADTLGQARDSLLDYQTDKWVWHCVARFGQGDAIVG
ncbi:hypothetical protein [Burkholderia anthina]|nr:hypothetical protein [Burkholderia anthina]